MRQNNEKPELTGTSASAQSAAMPAGDITLHWKWVERSVWTDRMLMALETGVKGSKWYSLMDKVWSPANLLSAWLGVKANDGAAGVDGQRVARFGAQYQEELERLRQELQGDTYRRQPARRVWIDKPGSREQRPLGIPCVRDRVAEGAVRQVIEPIFEREFAQHSYGFRPGHSAQQAVARVEELLREGYTHIVDADLKSYFDSIPQGRLREQLAERISDRRRLRLIDQFLSAGVMDTMEGWEPTERGTPQGAVISPLLANIYLNPLDHKMAGAGYAMTRYADDFVIQCRSQAEAQGALELVKAWVAQAGLVLHPDKTRQLTPRNSGQAMQEIVSRLNRSLRGWRGYFNHGVRNVPERLDQMVRRRLRLLLLKRRGKRGRPNKKVNQLWPNAYFDKLGLWRLAGDPS